MTARVVTVRADETVATAVERMKGYGFSAMPVVSPTFRLLGMVSLLDVLRYREVHAEEGLDADEHIAVSEIMNPEVVSMAATANAAVVATRLRENGQLRVLPVEQGDTLVGIVTRSDLLRGEREKPRGRPVVDDSSLLEGLARARRTGPPHTADSPVTEVMTSDIVAVTPVDPVLFAGRLMLRDRHPNLPVVEGDRLVGVISEADILADPLAGRGHGTVGSVMTRTPITLPTTATVAQARTLVADRGLRMVPVVDGARLIGVVSRSDLV